MRTSVNFRPICAALGIAILAISSTASATVHRVFPGNASSIQAAIDKAKPGDTILVEPGTYKFTPGPKVDGTYYYGLRIKTQQPAPDRQGGPGPGQRGQGPSRLRRPGR